MVLSLPLLPGYSFEKPGRTRYHKSQALVFKNKIMTIEDKPGIGGESLSKQTTADVDSNLTEPKWVVYDKQVLHFIAYWKESVTEMRHENYRVHKVRIYYYLEDDSILVFTDRDADTGLIQGIIQKKVFIKRHRIPLPPPNDDEFHTIEHFNIGKTVTFYGKTFLIASYADLFTEKFLQKRGFPILKSLEVPPDPGTKHIKDQQEHELMPLHPHIRTDTLQQFLQFDKTVLRFYGFWDDTESMFGDVHDLMLLFYLVDNTVEIREKILPNSGRDAFPMFLKRSRLPKKPKPILFPGSTKFPVLNVLRRAGSVSDEYYLLDSLKIGEPKTEFYKDTDLMIGAFVNVYGRKVVLYDCDEFTKDYYRSKYGTTDFTPLKPKLAKPKSAPPCVEIPPHVGFGSEEDSIQNVLHLTPSPPKIDFIKFVTLDKQKSNSHVLRFVARLADPSPLNDGRLFVISYFLVDDTISISELEIPNSGIYGGKFLQRGRLKKPISPNPPSGELVPVYYKASDFCIGDTLQLNGFKFYILNADEYCLRYMEDHPDQFPQANLDVIMKKIMNIIRNQLHEVKVTFAKFDEEAAGKVPYADFRLLLNQYVPLGLTEHEILMLARQFSRRTFKNMQDVRFLCAMAQKELIKHNFDDFAKLLETFRHYDSKRLQKLDRKELYTATRAFPVPISAELLKYIVELIEPIQDDKVPYEEFVNMLNWRQYPNKFHVPANMVLATVQTKFHTSYNVREVEYQEFFKALEKYE